MGEQLRISGMVDESIVDGPGIRMTIFAQGCKHNCAGCHNPQTHSFEGGELIYIEKILKSIKANILLDGITLSGGEPFEQAAAFALLAAEVKKLGLNVVTYTGYTYEQLIDFQEAKEGVRALLDNTDLLIDGPFVLEQKNMLLKFRGSDNQRIIDMNKTRANGKIELSVLM